MKSHSYHLFVTILFGPGDINKTRLISNFFVLDLTLKNGSAHKSTPAKTKHTYTY